MTKCPFKRTELKKIRMRILLLDFADSDPDPKLKEFKQKTNRIFLYLPKLLKPKQSKSFKPKNESIVFEFL